MITVEDTNREALISKMWILINILDQLLKKDILWMNLLNNLCKVIWKKILLLIEDIGLDILV
jgi:hypothetical protein